MASFLAPALSELVEAIRAAGISASTDPRDAVPPCALVMARAITPRTSCRVTVETEILLIAPGPGDGDAIEWLGDALDATWLAVGRWPGELTATALGRSKVLQLAYSLKHEISVNIPESSPKKEAAA
jgi:hypothetical protein